MILDGLTTRAMVEGEATRLDCSAAQTAGERKPSHAHRVYETTTLSY